jgi:hypothetical protein
LLDAVTVELDALLERRRQHVESNRKKMLSDARRDVDGARARLLAHVRELSGLRQTLLDARATVEWVASFPEPVTAYGFTSAVAIGLREPLEQTLGTRSRVEYASLMDALRADADALAEAFGPELGRELGLVPPATPFDTAMWDGDVPAEWKAEQLRRAQEVHRWSMNPKRVAQEADDFRPDPPKGEQ